MQDNDAPRIRDVGLTGLLVTFANRMDEPANRAALAFRAAIEDAGWNGVAETSSSLTSAFLRYDPLTVDRDRLADRLQALLDQRDWRAQPLPPGRRRWTIPVVLGGGAGPQFEDAAEAAGRTPEQAAEDIATANIRVLTLGFAPGQGYLGELPDHWNIPRQTSLTGTVPGGALVAAVRQLIVFAGPAPTGWRHIGQTAFRSYRPDTIDPFPLSPGDEVRFSPVSQAEFDRIVASDRSGEGGATAEALT